MKVLKRRSLIAGALALPALYYAHRWATKANMLALSGCRLMGVGVMPPGQLPFRGQPDAMSVVSVLNPISGESHHVVLPFPGGHSLLEIPSGFMVIGNRSAIGLVDRALGNFRRVEAPSGWHFGGHGVWLADQGMVLVGLRQASAINREGMVAIINPDTLELRPVGSSGGFEPHDMHILKDGRIAVGNYGNPTQQALNSYENLHPTIGMLDPLSLKVVATIDVPNIGSISHFAEGPAGQIATLPARLRTISEESIASVRTELGSEEFALSAVELVEGKVGFPSPVLTYGVAKNAWRSHLINPGKQRRPQSIAFHEASQAWFITYPFSEYLLRLGTDGAVSFVSSFSMGLSYPRGVMAMANDACIYVSGQYRGIAQIDAVTNQVVASWDVELFDATHLFGFPTI